LAIPTTSVQRAIKRGDIRPHTNAIKPLLTDINKEQRVAFCKSNINTERGMFHDMLDVIYVDEKWFYMTKNARRYYLGPDEPDPYRSTKSKRFSTKVMFLAAVARPRRDTGQKKHFDGKLGICQFTR
jgi:hypothetical protein